MIKPVSITSASLRRLRRRSSAASPLRKDHLPGYRFGSARDH